MMTLTVALVVAAIAEFRGAEGTTRFTRRAFGVVALFAFGVTADGVASWMGDVAALAAGVLP